MTEPKVEVKHGLETKVGLEAEFLLKNDKDETIIPPSSWDRDGFPLLGEIRGKEGKNPAEVVTNFQFREMEIRDRLRKGHRIIMTDVETVPLKLYKAANRQVDWEEKQAQLGEVKNIYGIDIEDFSDQVVKGNKIQGIRVSCGLHVHFSCAVYDSFEYDEPQYERVILPIGGTPTQDPAEADSEMGYAQLVAHEMTKRCLYLYRDAGYKKKKILSVCASRLNKPAIEFIVRKMDEEFFDSFAPEEKVRTKFRQKGMYELKPYGFEYRSLPANAKTMAALPEIVGRSFELLKEINEF